jgi:hypothetical protein
MNDSDTSAFSLEEILSRDHCLALQTFEKGHVGEATWQILIGQISATLVEDALLDDGNRKRSYSVQKNGIELLITATTEKKRGRMRVSHTLRAVE